MIHYPQDRVDGMISHLGSLADERLIISFAPKTLAYSILKRIGELFPGPSKVHRSCVIDMDWRGRFWAVLGTNVCCAQCTVCILQSPCNTQATRAYLHAEADVEAALERAGWKVVKRDMTATQFYFSRLLEARRA